MTSLTVVIILKCIEILNHYVATGTTQPCRSVLPQKQTSTRTHSKKNRSDLWLPDVGGGEREADEGSLNVQISATR